MEISQNSAAFGAPSLHGDYTGTPVGPAGIMYGRSSDTALLEKEQSRC